MRPVVIQSEVAALTDDGDDDDEDEDDGNATDSCGALWTCFLVSNSG